MATISSLGIGSGLDSESIVTKLAALEKAPLAGLQAQQKIGEGKISVFGQIQSQFSALQDAATALSSTTALKTTKASSSNSTAATITSTSSATPTSFSFDVDQLAKVQSNASAAVTADSLVGAGTLTFQLGTWTGGAADAAANNVDLATKTAELVAAQSAYGVALTAHQTYASDLDTFAQSGTPVNATTAQTYADAYSAWVTAVDTNDGTAATKLSDLNAAYGALDPADQTAISTSYTAPASDLATLKQTVLTKQAAVTAVTPTFAAGGSSSFDIAVLATDTVTKVAAKINAANKGVVATVFRDGSGTERLLLQGKNTGAANGFRVTASVDADGVTNDNAGLSRFAYNPAAGTFGMAASGNSAQYASNAKARINGMVVNSTTNTFTDNVPGVSITVAATTTTNYNNVGGTEVRNSITMSVSEDVTPAVKSVDAFVKAYNALAANLAELTKYDAATKTPGAFQGDASVNGLLSVLRSMVGSASTGSAYSRLSDVGIQMKRDGTLTVDTIKLGAAANNGDELTKLFTTDNKNEATNGFALKFVALAKGVLGTGGAVTNKAKALQKELTTNATEQEKVNDRAAAVEARLRKRYAALDTQMANLNALNAYVAQQVTTWNKSTG